MPAPAYQRLADDIRHAITSGAIPPGSTLPKTIEQYAAEYEVSKMTAVAAIRLLEAEGLVGTVKRRGTVVRERPERQRITRAREAYRDELGYYFDPAAQPWRALEPPTVTWGPPPPDIARILGAEPGADVLIRRRIMGDPAASEATQIAVSYLPAWLAAGTALAEADTGAGGIYDRMERDMGHGPLAWEEGVSARMPAAEEAAVLRLARGVPLLQIVRTTRSSDGRVLEVNATIMSAERFEVGYAITRHASARPTD